MGTPIAPLCKFGHEWRRASDAQRMCTYYHNLSKSDLLAVTRTLLKFCREHGYPEGGLAHLDECARCLAADDMRSAIEHFRAVPLGGMGCFNDWYPEVVYKHETAEYVSVEFDALLERWSRLMRMAAGDSA